MPSFKLMSFVARLPTPGRAIGFETWGPRGPPPARIPPPPPPCRRVSRIDRKHERKYECDQATGTRLASPPKDAAFAICTPCRLAHGIVAGRKTKKPRRWPRGFLRFG